MLGFHLGKDAASQDRGVILGLLQTIARWPFVGFRFHDCQGDVAIVPQKEARGAGEADYSPVTNSSIPSARGGIHARSFGGNKTRSSGGARNVVTITMRVTAPKSFASNTPLESPI